MKVHPACDLWMRGVKTVRIVTVGRKWVTVESTDFVANGRKFKFTHAAAKEYLEGYKDER